jgi:hypothetical protein
MGWAAWVRFSAGADLFFLHSVHTGSGAAQRMIEYRGMKLTNHFYLVPKS